MKKQNIIAVCLLLSTFGVRAQTISTVAGNGTSGFMGDGAAATAAEIKSPFGVAVDGSGNMFVADYLNGRIRKVNSAGIITTFSDTGINAECIAVDGSGNVYYGDASYNYIYKVTTSGVRSVIAGNGTSGFSGDGLTATAAEINFPNGIAVDGSGNVYINDNGNNRIRKVNTSGIISTIAGTGVAGYSGDGAAATAAKINSPEGVAVDGSGNVYIYDGGNFRIRKIDGTGTISTIAGIGTSGYSGDGAAATAAQIGGGMGVAADGVGNVYICDHDNQRIRKVNGSGIISTVAGNGYLGYFGDGMSAIMAELNDPAGLTLDATGNIFISDIANYRIRKVTNSAAEVKQPNLANYDISLFPNPNLGAFTLKGSLNSITDETVSVIVVDMFGQVAYNKEVATKKGMINTQVIIPGIANGIYFLKINSETESLNYRFMIEK